MDGSNPQRRSGSRRGPDPLEQRLDRWVSAGRQLVDGVAGARPGSRPGTRGTGRRAAGLPRPGGLGRWVEDRLDWLLEDDDDWREPWQEESPPPAPAPRRREPLRPAPEPSGGGPGARRSLEAISRRGSELPSAAESWPDDSSFQPSRWQRPPRGGPGPVEPPTSPGEPAGGRPLPRSSRRRP